jgi:hypothetical protein
MRLGGAEATKRQGRDRQHIAFRLSVQVMTVNGLKPDMRQR